MARKSSLNLVAPEVQSLVLRLFRENRLTLDQIVAQAKAEFPGEQVPSRSALGRAKKGFDAMIERMREQENMGRMLVAELGESPDDKAGALMVQSLSVLMNDVLNRSQGQDKDIAIDDVRKLARAAKDTIQARSASLKERQAIEKAAREKLLEEQKEKLAAMPVKGGVTEETKAAIREALGIN